MTLDTGYYQSSQFQNETKIKKVVLDVSVFFLRVSENISARMGGRTSLRRKFPFICPSSLKGRTPAVKDCGVVWVRVPLGMN